MPCHRRACAGPGCQRNLTDVHAERLAFFQAVLQSRKFAWDAGRTAVLAAGSPLYLTTGQVSASDDEACRANLEFLGSRLVFLIDWNRARKQLRVDRRGIGTP
jgi:hypothetical protein